MRKVPVAIILLFSIFSCSQKNSESQVLKSETRAPIKVANLSAIEFKAGIESPDAILIDVRTPQEVSQGKIEKALSYDYYDPSFAEKILELPKDKKIYIYCSAGVRSAEAAKFLSENGYERIHHLTGGLGPWVDEGFDLN